MSGCEIEFPALMDGITAVDGSRIGLSLVTFVVKGRVADLKKTLSRIKAADLHLLRVDGVPWSIRVDRTNMSVNCRSLACSAHLHEELDEPSAMVLYLMTDHKTA